MPLSPLHKPLLDWYDTSARRLPWREPRTSGWGVLVSEVMLQQTPVSRVLPVYGDWVEHWPTPAALAASAPGDAVRQWGRLGYPRRALRLHAAAVQITDRHGGDVPAGVGELRKLPGVGAYTAAAVASFAFAQRHAVLDTNVRRVLARLVEGTAGAPARLAPSEVRRAELLLPDEPAVAARWSVAVMELGALVCRPRKPRCEQCPLIRQCRWRAAGTPAAIDPARRKQTYAGTDRECRGRLLAVLRRSAEPVSEAALSAAWHDSIQQARALSSLLDDGLVERLTEGRYQLPG